MLDYLKVVAGSSVLAAMLAILCAFILGLVVAVFVYRTRRAALDVAGDIDRRVRVLERKLPQIEHMPSSADE